METAETNTSLTEQELVEHWRSSNERAGYPADVAAELASRSDIDLHQAAELLQRGCSPSSPLRSCSRRTRQPGSATPHLLANAERCPVVAASPAP